MNEGILRQKKEEEDCKELVIVVNRQRPMRGNKDGENANHWRDRHHPQKRKKKWKSRC